MDRVIEAIVDYLNQKNVPPYLVLKIEISGLKSQLLQMGFEERDGYMVISKDDAFKAARQYYDFPEPFDWNKHWQQERQREF